VIYGWHELVLAFAKDANLVPEDFTMSQFWGWPEGFFYGCSEPFKEMLVGKRTLYAVEELLPDAYDVLWKLAEYCDIFYLTARKDDLIPTTYDWFAWSELPSNTPDRIFTTNGGKRDIISLLKPSYYVDDRVGVIEELKDITQMIHLVREWSVDYYDDDVIRIENIKQLLDIIK